MAVATSAWWDAVTALLAMFRADATLTTNKVRIVDGPLLLDAAGPNTLIVGGTSDLEAVAPVGDFAQEWGESGARARYETLSVVCELSIRGGSTKLSDRRATAKTVLSQIEALVRTQFTLGVTTVLWAQVLNAQIRQLQAQTGGSTVIVTFTIAAKARLASQ